MEIKEISAADTWLIRQKVMWPDRDISYVQLPDDKNGKHYGLFEDERLISIISLFRSEESVQFRKFATVQDKQQMGYGSLLLSFVLDNQPGEVRRVWCNARLNKAGFYERFGMAKTDETFTKGGIDYVIMELNR